MLSIYTRLNSSLDPYVWRRPDSLRPRVLRNATPDHCRLCQINAADSGFLHINYTVHVGFCGPCTQRINWASRGCPVCNGACIGVVNLHSTFET